MVHICDENSSGPGRRIKMPLLLKLDALGFFSFVPSTLKPRIFDIVLESKSLFLDEVQRSFFLDAEEAFEQGISVIFSAACPLLANRGIQLPPFEEKYTPDGNYSVLINGVPYFLIKPRTASHTSEWHTAAMAGLEIIGDLLEKGGSEDRIFYDPGSGNDGTVFFLSENVFSILLETGIFIQQNESPFSDLSERC